MSEATLVYPHQLFQSNPAIKKGRDVYLIEDPLFFSQYRFHRQKLMLHRASMKRYESDLKRRKLTTHYIDRAQIRISSDIAVILGKGGIQKAHWIDPEDNYLQRRVQTALSANRIQTSTLNNPN
ncbi:MAG: cryptochrome/photolyase family protein, partial [Planctomycetes bacterium]|nr:cryptochrome/photolyase family protein [Planctomycetota bacterium]